MSRAHDPDNMADKLWQELLLSLHAEQLSLDDLPVTEELLWGTLRELGFNSYLDRAKLCKVIIQAHEGHAGGTQKAS